MLGSEQGLGKYIPFAGFLVILLAIFFIAENKFARSFKDCIYNEAAQQTADAYKDHGQIIVIGIEAQAICSLRLLDRHNGFFAALASLVIAGFTFTLWRSTSRQGDLTREAMIAGERAFVFPVGFTQLWEKDATDNYCWRFRPTWENSGDTPTAGLVLFTECEIRNDRLPADYPFIQVVQDNASGLIPPKSKLNGGLAPRPGAPPVTPQDIVDMQAGKKFIYLWGWAQYNDVFPDTPRHITRFSWMITVLGDPFAFIPGIDPPAPGSLRFGNLYANRGNCADDECKTQGL